METPSYTIRDPIHGLVDLNEKEVKLINTKAFQRLRRIRQLAMAFLVYPGTLHTRFDHSIGVMHIAGRICSRLMQLEPGKITEVDRQRIRLAALLHDIGHGPFSHVSEHLLESYTPKGKTGAVREKIHEKVTVDIINTDAEIRAILTDKESEFVVNMIRGELKRRDFRRDIVSSDLDADKLDYLLRDSYFAGVKYGTYDLDKIIESCRVFSKGQESYLAISDEGIYALEQLLLAKHHMTQQVYRHKVRSISDAMIVRGISLAIRDGNQEIKALYEYDGTPAFIETYVEYHDERLIDVLKRCEQEKANEIFNRLYERRLFKRICELPLKDREVPDGHTRERLSKMVDEDRQEWEDKIANSLGIDRDLVIVNRVQIRNPNYGSRSYSLSQEQIWILDEKQGYPKKLIDYPTELVTTRSSPHEIAETVEVYAPQDHWRNLSLADRKAAQLEAEVRDLLLSA